MTTLDRKNFITLIDQQQTDLFFLENENKTIRVAITNYGARIVGLWILQSDKWVNIVAGFDDIHSYLQPQETYFGATIGRFANRINKGVFTILGKQYQVSINNNDNHLHGGENGFHKKIWSLKSHTKNTIQLFLFSPDGEEGYPANVNTTIFFSLEHHALTISFQAVPDADTHLNFTHHSFFNLNGDGQQINEHILHINANAYTPISQNLIPTGNIESIENTPFDFRQAKPIGQDMQQIHEQLTIAKGYDHNFVLNKNNPKELSLAATVEGNTSRIKMNLYTTAQGLQLYTGNFLAGQHHLNNGYYDTPRSFVCLEPQAFPNSPNHANFTNTLVKANETYQTTMQYEFVFS